MTATFKFSKEEDQIKFCAALDAAQAKYTVEYKDCYIVKVKGQFRKIP